MDVLSRLLNKGAVDNIFRLHPSCQAPLVTHLSFADDVLVFFDGSEDSLRGILGIMEDFKRISGLSMNHQKTELLIDGGSNLRCRELANRVGVSQGSLPVRYMGVPLSSRKMKKADFQPLFDKLSTRFSSWTVKHLSYAGRLILVKTVIYPIITFWASVFLFPVECAEALERMCNGFLWKGDSSSARGAKVAWDTVCTPAVSIGLGLKRIAQWNQVLILKLIWLIFAENCSLWVCWIKVNKIGGQNFWTLDARTQRSRIWKSICSLRSVARQFMVCDVGSGITASFWEDSWTHLGPLIEITGPEGPQVSGLPLEASVSEAISNGDWWLSPMRTRNPLIQLLKHCLPEANPIAMSDSDDKYAWKVADQTPVQKFPTAATWKFLHPPGQPVSWHKQVWFAGHIPKHAFFTWVNVRHRVATHDRMRRWGLQVPTSCVLCASHDESRQHIFFDCAFSSAVWSHFMQKINLQPPQAFESLLSWLGRPFSNSHLVLIIRFIYQASKYAIWKERNSRIHS